MKEEVTQLLVQGAQLWEEQKADKLLNTKVHGTGHPIRVLRAVNIIRIYGHTQTAALWPQQKNLGQLVRIVVCMTKDLVISLKGHGPNWWEL